MQLAKTAAKTEDLNCIFILIILLIIMAYAIDIIRFKACTGTLADPRVRRAILMQVVHSLPTSSDHPARQLMLCIRLASLLLQLIKCFLFN